MLNNIFSQMTKIFPSRASPFLVERQILLSFCRSGDLPYPYKVSSKVTNISRSGRSGLSKKSCAYPQLPVNRRLDAVDASHLYAQYRWRFSQLYAILSVNLYAALACMA